MNKLIEEAKKEGGSIKNFNTKAHVELAVAYLNGEVTTAGVKKALGVKHNSQVTHYIPSILRTGVQIGWVEIKIK